MSVKIHGCLRCEVIFNNVSNQIQPWML